MSLRGSPHHESTLRASTSAKGELGPPPLPVERLYEVSKRLLEFESIERTVPEVIALIADAIPLHNAIFMDGAGEVRTLIEPSGDRAPSTLTAARAHAERAYAYLVPTSDAVTRHAGVPSDGAAENQRELPVVNADHHYVVLPLVVREGAIFGALQIESVRALDEHDLFFVNVVVNQLATALDRDRTECALRASKAELTAIVSIAADAVISADAAQNIVMYNEGAEKIFGWCQAEVLGKPLDLLLPGRFRQSHRAQVSELGEGPDTSRRMADHRAGIRGLRKNGEEFFVEVAVSKVSVDGVLLFTAILRDISEQIQSAQEEAFLVEVGAVLATSLELEQTLSNIAALALRKCGDLCIVEFEDKEQSIHGLEVVSSDPAHAELVHAFRKLHADGGGPQLDFSLLYSNPPANVTVVTPTLLCKMAVDEEPRRLLSAMAPQAMMGVSLCHGDRVFGSMMVAVCSSGRCYEEVDRRLLVEVAQQGSRALESARLYQVAQRAVRSRDDLLGIVAHDLRNPLGSIVLNTTLLRAHGGAPERRSTKPAEAIARAAKRIDRLMEDLVDITSLEAGQLSVHLSSVEPSRPLLDAVASQRALATSRALDLQLAVPPGLPLIWADNDRLLQVFENLIGNAAKFTDATGRINLGAQAREQDVLFWVADTGKGICAEDLPRLFDRFWQAESSERRGAGLGLAIVKGIVESHRGKIWVESVAGEGSTFYFTIPRWPPESEHAAINLHEE